MLKKTCHFQLFEDLFVHSTYQSIAQHFSNTRYKPWPQVQSFLSSLPPDSLILDIGCGNGKYIHSNPQTTIGTDVSSSLLEICASFNFSVFRSNCLSLPIKSESFDAAIAIAVIHHLSSPERRKKAIQEMIRVLRPGGVGLLYVWAKEQEERKFEKQDVLVPWKSGKQGGQAFPRFFHCFVEGELENLVREVECEGFRFKVARGYYDRSNWCVVVEKIRVGS